MPSAHVQPEAHYARSGDVSIAYQVVGEGPVDLVLVHGWICTFHPGWGTSESPASTGGSPRWGG